MKQQIGAFRDQMVAVVLDRSYHGFHRLFAELLGAVFRALVQELARIGRLSARRRAGIDDGDEVMNRETCHQLNSACAPQRIRTRSPTGFSTSVTNSRQGSCRIGSPARTI